MGDLDIDRLLDSQGQHRIAEGVAKQNPSVGDLISAWRTEVSTPAILVFQHELVASITQLLVSQEVSATTTSTLNTPLSHALMR